MRTLLNAIEFLIILADGGAAFRILYCLLRLMGNPDEKESYVKKIIHVLIYAAFANSSLALMILTESYFL